MRTLVIYFSVSGNTAEVARALAQVTDADLFEIVPERPYTAADVNWKNPLACFLQVQIPERCRQKWRILHLRFGESCRLPGRVA
jgi:hypothetical protein